MPNKSRDKTPSKLDKRDRHLDTEPSEERTLKKRKTRPRKNIPPPSSLPVLFETSANLFTNTEKLKNHASSKLLKKCLLHIEKPLLTEDVSSTTSTKDKKRKKQKSSGDSEVSSTIHAKKLSGSSSSYRFRAYTYLHEMITPGYRSPHRSERSRLKRCICVEANTRNISVKKCVKYAEIEIITGLWNSIIDALTLAKAAKNPKTYLQDRDFIFMFQWIYPQKYNREKQIILPIPHNLPNPRNSRKMPPAKAKTKTSPPSFAGKGKNKKKDDDNDDDT